MTTTRLNVAPTCSCASTPLPPPNMLSRLGQEQLYRYVFETGNSRRVVTFVAEYRNLQSLGLCWHPCLNQIYGRSRVRIINVTEKVRDLTWSFRANVGMVPQSRPRRSEGLNEWRRAPDIVIVMKRTSKTLRHG